MEGRRRRRRRERGTGQMGGLRKRAVYTTVTLPEKDTYKCAECVKDCNILWKVIIYFQVRYAYACSMAFRGRHFECGF